MVGRGRKVSVACLAGLGVLLLVGALALGVRRYIRDRDPAPLLGRWRGPGRTMEFRPDGTMRRTGTSGGFPLDQTHRWYRQGDEIFLGASSYAYFHWVRVGWRLSPDRQTLRLTFYREANSVVVETDVVDYQRE